MDCPVPKTVHPLFRRGYLGSTSLVCRAVAQPLMKLEICYKYKEYRNIRGQEYLRYEVSHTNFGIYMVNLGIYMVNLRIFAVNLGTFPNNILQIKRLV